MGDQLEAVEEELGAWNPEGNLSMNQSKMYVFHSHNKSERGTI
jgi:hypothetical protein